MIDESIFKAYDIRGTYPDQLDEDLARDIGRAFVNHLGLPGSRVVVARDMRLSGEDLQAAFIEGVTEAGADVLSLGMVSDRRAVLRRGAPGGAGGGHDHGLPQPQELQRLQAVPREGHSALRGVGIGEIRDLITSGKLPEPAEYPGSVERWTSRRTTPSTAWGLSRRRA
jgi:phosphomannomutase